ncbi:Omega-protein [Citrus sinensis]|uniref:Omega-protein n=1 Tax=Citrus sinensis TaxID=2711 RepID=A0ACB8NLI3_CITSI|nr:Omega-protein [Citrus sinensis]
MRLAMRRSLFSLPLATATTTSTLPTSSSTRSAVVLRPFMATLQHRAFRNHQVIQLPPYPLIGSGLRFRKGRVTSAITISYPKVACDFFLFRGRSDCSKGALSIHSHLKPRSSFCYMPLDNGIRFSSLNCEPFSKRCFSQLSRGKIGIEKIGVSDARSGSGGGKSWFNKHRKRNNAVSARGKSNATSSSISVSEDVNAVNSTSEQLVGDGVEGTKLGSSVSNTKQNSKPRARQQQQSRSKKKKEQLSATVASEQASVGKSCKSVSLAKSSKCKSKQCADLTSEPFQKTSPGNTLEQPLASSALTKQQSKKNSGNCGRKKKSAKATKASLQRQTSEEMVIVPRGQNTQNPLYPPSGKSVVVVESVTKAKVIQGYLGDMYEVLPSYGHVRDLAARSGSVRPDDDFSMVWEVPSAAWTHLKSIKVALSGLPILSFSSVCHFLNSFILLALDLRAENLILASDPDREGEAIAWHIVEMLQQQDALHENITVARVVFHEITEASIKVALQAPREIDANLVQAYLARRALDYLIGFNISPLLWRKLPGCQSAGRVQSAALSLICDREMEIDEFKPQEYWTVEAVLDKKESHSLDTFSFPAHLTHFQSKRLNQLSISSHTEAKDIEQKINSANFQVIKNSKRSMVRKNPTPYITSTLQQDAANKLNFSATYTMKLAQKLYEGVQLPDETAAGLITYMRTDGLHISDEAAKEIRSLIFERYGSHHAPEEGPRKYFKKVKNAQEAHEAIRPTDIRRLPAMLSGLLDEDCLKLYSLIWSRTMACQMQPATVGQIQVDIGNVDESIVFRSSCSRVEFLGFQAAYEDVDAGAIRYKENEENDRHEAFAILNSLKVPILCTYTGDPLYLGEVELKQHHTQPPARYSEGSLVKKLEELGIGRPSTYASTLKVLQDRNYVTVKSRILYPEFRGRMVSAFLSHYFSEVTDYSFTADMETELDNVSAGLTEWKGLLVDYWSRFSSYCTCAQSLHIHQVEKMLEKTFGDSLFASLPNKDRSCPVCGEGTLIFKVSRFGAGYFIGCNQHPRCNYIAKTLYGDDDEEDTLQRNTNVDEPKLIGHHPASKEKVLLKSGPYGFYVQLGEDRTGYLPKRASVSHIKDVDSITLEDALELLRYPVNLGNHPKDGQPIMLRLARAGFSVRHRRTIASVPKNMKPNDVTLEKALEFLSGKDVRRCGRPKGKPKREEALEAM